MTRRRDDPVIARHVGGLIARRRVEVGLSQEELAQQAEVSRALISLYEVGARVPSIYQLVVLAEVMEVKASVFLEGL